MRLASVFNVAALRPHAAISAMPGSAAAVRSVMSAQRKKNRMNIPQLCAQLLQQGEIIRMRCKQVRTDLSIIFALQEFGTSRHKETEAIYYDRLEQTTKDVAAGKATLLEAEETLRQLKSKVATRPIPFVRV